MTKLLDVPANIYTYNIKDIFCISFGQQRYNALVMYTWLKVMYFRWSLKILNIRLRFIKGVGVYVVSGSSLVCLLF